MSSMTVEKEARFKSLREAYQLAFQQLALQVRLLQTLTSDSAAGSAAVHEAKARVDSAEIAYHASRDRLAEFLMLNSPDSVISSSRSASAAATAVDGGDQKSQVEHLAYHLWESAGRPTGSAETDWRRAEHLVRNRP